ncbi:Protein disulfide-isomerase TMX3 [Aphelenchoides besseyi]|nr:Protein disulfide-isomerase TMX3 [Aphelenchoides besseyi]
MRLLGLSALTVICLMSMNNGTKIPTEVIELNDRFLEVMDKGFWFVKFYAPWCAHCKRLLPTWEHVGHALADTDTGVKVAKIDCTRFTSVSSKLRINAYPTIIFFRNGVQIPYEGERKKESLVEFAIKSAGPIIGNIESSSKLSELRKSTDKDPIFVYVDGDNRELFQQYENVSEKLFTETRFFRSRSTHLPSTIQLKELPDVIVFKDGSFQSFRQNGGDYDLAQWIKIERWPLIPLVTSSNVHVISEDTDKILVLGLVDMIERSNMSTESGKFFKLFKKAALLAENDQSTRSRFKFGWMDGNSIANSVVMGEMSIPGLLIFNVSSYEFYLLDDSPQKMTAQSLLGGLQPIMNGEATALGGRSWPQRFRRMGYEITKNVYDMFYHQPILTMCLFGVPLAFFSIITYSICSADFSVDRDEVFPSSDEEDGADENELEENEIEDQRTDDDQPLLRRRKSYATGSESVMAERRQNESPIEPATIKQQILEALNSVRPTDHVNFLVNRLVSVDVETSKARNEVKTLREQAKKSTLLEKKLQTVEKALSKAELAKTKLEELCRQLNRSKKEDAEANFQQLKRMEQAHAESLDKFKSSIGDMQLSIEGRKEQAQRMEDVEKLSASLADLSVEYEKRLKELKNLYEEREHSIKEMVAHKDEELEHLRGEINGMKDKIQSVFQENVDLKRELMHNEEKVKKAIESDLMGRQTIESYGSKYKELLQTLEQSNISFDRARNDMTKMNGQLIKLQGDSARYKKQLQEKNEMVLALSATKLEWEEERQKKDKQIAQLQQLCRHLQKSNGKDVKDAVPEPTEQSEATKDLVSSVEEEAK